MTQSIKTIPTKKGSVTVEASMAIPIFLLAVLCLVYLLEIYTIGLSIRFAATHAAKAVAQDIAVEQVFQPAKLQANLVNLVGTERLNRSVIEGGMGGINCSDSYFSPIHEELAVKVKYRVKLPILMFGNPTVKQEAECKVKAWTGYVKPSLEAEDYTVYITATGTVYHENYQCTYLQLSIQFVPAEDVPDLRNSDGGKYYKCEKCIYGGGMAGVYITDSGNKYHNSLNCSGLKRTIQAVQKSQVKGLGGCHRCSR